NLILSAHVVAHLVGFGVVRFHIVGFHCSRILFFGLHCVGLAGLGLCLFLGHCFRLPLFFGRCRNRKQCASGNKGQGGKVSESSSSRHVVCSFSSSAPKWLLCSRGTQCAPDIGQ